MSPITRVLSYASTKLASTMGFIASYLFDLLNTSPLVPTLLVGCVNMILYALNPCAFLARCQERYGPVYSMSLGPLRLKVVASGDAISSVFLTSHQLLRNDITHREVFNAVGGIKANHDHLNGVMVRELHPIIERHFSPRFLEHSTQGFGLVLLSKIEHFVQDQSGSTSLTALTNVPLYDTTNHILLGSAFPIGTYPDFRTLDKSVPYRLGRTLLWRWPSYAAQMRLLKTFADYLERVEVTIIDHDDKLQFIREAVKALKNNNIQSSEATQVIFTMIWAAHSNTMNTSRFLLSFLLSDPHAFARVRAEIDSVVEKFGSLEKLLEAGADKLDDPSFTLLSSAIMETMRLTALHAGIREANCDFDLKVKGTTIPIKKGEFVFGDVRAAHMDADTFTDPETFVVDRFAQHPYQRKHLQTEGYSFHSLGGGRHICKGRWLAVYALKVLTIILIHKFDFLPEGDNSADWCSLRVHPRSLGFVHTEDDVLVRVIPRDRDAVL